MLDTTPTRGSSADPAPALALAAILCALCFAACGDDGLDPGPAYRPSIDAGLTRCGPIEVVPLDHAVRLTPLPGGELLLAGNSFDPFHTPTGHVVRFDPTGQRDAEAIDLDRSIAAVTPDVDELLLTDHGGLSTRWTLRPLRAVERLAPSDFDAVTAPDTALPPGRHLFVGGYERLGQFSPRTPAVVVYDLDLQRPVNRALFQRFDALGNAQGAVGEVTGLVHVPPAGRVLVAGIDASPGPQPERFGFLGTLGITGLPFATRHWPQDEFEPLRLVLDDRDRPWVLAVEDHVGDRYVDARPIMARVDVETLELLERRRVDLPPDVSQGAVMAAVPLPDGGWIFGGSVCGEARAWCQAWLGRLDADGDIVWSRRASRDVASTVSDLHVVGERIIAAVSSSVYCCQWRELHQDAWLWAVEIDGECPADNRLRRDGVVLR